MEALSWLQNDPSVEYAKAFIDYHPDMALMGINDDDDIFVPLHIAISSRASDGVILLLLEACPQAAAAEDNDKFLPLHLALNEDTMCSAEVIKALLNAHPGATSERNPQTGNLPLHDVVENMNASEGIILLLIKSYPQAAFEMKDGRLLVEIYLKRERRATVDFMREICKVRINGLLPLGVVLTKRSSDDIVLAVLEAYPEAARKRFSTKWDEFILPLHIAYEDKHSEPVKDALRHAYPDAEKENPFETTYLLHKFLENGPLDQDGDDVENLIEKYPEAVGKRGRDGRLPLHIAIDRIAPVEVTSELFYAYPQAGKEKMKGGRLPIEVFAEQKVTEDWSQSDLIEMVTELLKYDMPVSIVDGTPVEHSGSWHACISYSTETATDAVRKVLLDSNKRDDDGNYGGGFGKHIHALAEVHDAMGRSTLGLASKESHEVIYDCLFPSKLHKFLGNEPLDPDGDDVRNLIEMYPEALGKRGGDGRLPLHIALEQKLPEEIVLLILNAYPQAAKEKWEDGRLPIEVCAERNVSKDLVLALSCELSDDAVVALLHEAIYKGRSQKMVKALLDASPDAAKKIAPTNDLLLHAAINTNASEDIILLILNAYLRLQKRR
eukprot:scaffold4673_cov82-Skeletonema_dohrnii-CCMP3373.AAC.1